MKDKLIIPILFVALVAGLGWGYSQYQDKRQWEINAENQYQRAFEELTASVSNMETEMTKSLVSGSLTQTIKQLTNIWREANTCQQNLGQLPLTSVELSRTKMLLAKAGAYCFNTAQEKLVKGSSVDEKEWTTLKQFRDQTRMVSKQLFNLRDEFFNNRARWLEVDRLGTLGAVDVGSDLQTNKVTKSFIMLEDGLRRTPDIAFEGNPYTDDPKATGLTGANISSRDATIKARQFLGPQYQKANIKYERIIKGGFPTYMITARIPKKPDSDRSLSISVKGGHVAWMLGNRNVDRTRYNLDQAEQQAKAFLTRNGMGNVEVVAREKFDNIATFTCAPVRNDVIFYPELIKLQVAQDNGEVIGYDAIPYLTFNNPAANQVSTPMLSKATILKSVNSHLKVEQVRLAQVLDEVFNKVLCYEVQGTQGNDRFLVYYNANTGKEEKIRRIDQNGNEIQ